jgi:hypothetical protein
MNKNIASTGIKNKRDEISMLQSVREVSAMKKIEVGVDKSDIRYTFKKLFEKGKISEAEYTRALNKVAALKLN